jgi:hypothetical protein
MAAGRDRDLQLGADAVRRRNQDRVAEPGGLEIEQRAEPAQPGIGAGPGGGARQRLDRLDQRVARVDVDAGLTVLFARYGVLVRSRL